MRKAIFFLLILTTAVSSMARAQRPAGDGRASGEFWAPGDPPRAKYVIEGRIDPAGGRINGTEVVRLTNTTSRPFARLALDWTRSEGQTLQIVIGDVPIRLMTDAGKA